METILKADIFFFVTTIVVLVLAVVSVVALIYLIRILKNVFYISKVVKRESDETAKDLSDLRRSLREEASKLKEDIDVLSDKTRAEGEEVLTSFGSAHKAVKKEAKRIWSLFTFLLSFFTMRKVVKKIKSKKKKKTYVEKNK